MLSLRFYLKIAKKEKDLCKYIIFKAILFSANIIIHIDELFEWPWTMTSKGGDKADQIIIGTTLFC